MISIILFSLNILALIGAILWLISSPDYEPAITSLVLVASLVGLFVSKRKHQKNVTINETSENINSPSKIISPINETSENINSPSEIISPINETSENINSPSEIIRAIENRPPYQRKDAEKYYIGLKVHWKGELCSANPQDEGRIRVFLLGDKRARSYVVFSVKQADYPELKSMDENTEIELKGTILKIDSHVITLENVKIV